MWASFNLDLIATGILKNQEAEFISVPSLYNEANYSKNNWADISAVIPSSLIVIIFEREGWSLNELFLIYSTIILQRDWKLLCRIRKDVNQIQTRCENIIGV